MISRPPPRTADAQWISDRILLGSSLRNGQGGSATERLRELVDVHGLTHILDCRSEAHDRYLVEDHAPEVVYLRCPLPEDPSQDLDDWFRQGVNAATTVLEDPASTLLVHCSNGQTRGPSMAFAILLAQGRPAADALTTIVTARRTARVEYASLALSWHLRRSSATPEERERALRDLSVARRTRPRHGNEDAEGRASRRGKQSNLPGGPTTCLSSAGSVLVTAVRADDGDRIPGRLGPERPTAPRALVHLGVLACPRARGLHCRHSLPLQTGLFPQG